MIPTENTRPLRRHHASQDVRLEAPRLPTDSPHDLVVGAELGRAVGTPVVLKYMTMGRPAPLCGADAESRPSLQPGSTSSGSKRSCWFYGKKIQGPGKDASSSSSTFQEARKAATPQMSPYFLLWEHLGKHDLVTTSVG